MHDALKSIELQGCTHLECTKTGERYDSERLQTLSRAGAPLYPRYDLSALGTRFRRETLKGRSADLWRYAEVLPVRSSAAVVCLGEGWTPLLRVPRLAATLSMPVDLWIKDEGQNPTASFKARGMAVAVSRAKELGATAIALPSAGNAGSAAAAYAAAAGLAAHVVMPRSTPSVIVAECRALGAEVTLIEGVITDCGKQVRDGVTRFGWFDVSTLKEPYRVEGKKTMGYEVAEQFDWVLPDVIVYPTGGGTGLVGMWKAFEEMEALGWIGPKRPRMVSVQAEGCAPIVRAWEEGTEAARAWDNPHTIAAGLCVPAAVGDFLMLRAIRASGGAAVCVSDQEMVEATGVMSRTTGIFPAPEGAATAACLPRLLHKGVVRPDDRVLLFNTGSGLKYVG